MDPTENKNEMNDEVNDTQALLTAYALGELQGEDLAKVEALLASDPAAQAEVDEIRHVGKQLEEALAAEGAGATAGLKPEQVQAIHAKAEQGNETEEAVVARLIRPWMWWAAGSAAAAMFAVALILPSIGPVHRSHYRNPFNSSDVAMVDKYKSNTDELTPSPSPITQRSADGGRSRSNTAAQGGSRDNDGQATGATSTAEALRSGVRGKLDGEAKSDGPEFELSSVLQSPADQKDARQKAQVHETVADKGVASAAPVSPPVASKPMSSDQSLVINQVGRSVALKKEKQLAFRAENDAMRRIAPEPGQVNPNFHTEAYDTITDNPFLKVAQNPLSTFSIDVDTASYANVRRMLTQNQLPPAGAVRIEEMVNYFPYNYSNPAGDERPFAVHVETGSAPWAHQHRLVKIGIKGKEIAAENKPVTNIVFLIDVSGSMMQQNKLPLLKEGMKLLVKQMDEKDHVAIAVYAGAAGMVLDSTSGKDQDTIMAAIENLRGGGSTNGGAGIELAYKLASKNFVKEGVNRVILASDGDFNVGTTSQDELVKLIEEKRKTGVFLSVLGFGNGNYKDSTMEKLANKGNGNYAYIDTLKEAQKVLVEQGAGTLYTIAKDVKIQVEFNPAKVQAYRLIGYENRLLAKEDFNDDTKDAGEIGAGHTVTALYEVVPVGIKGPGVPPVDPLKYQTTKPAADKTATPNAAEASNELLTVKLRYKLPDGDVSTKMDVPVVDAGKPWQDASEDYRFAASVAEFGMLLRNSPYKGDGNYAQVLDLAQSGLGKDAKGYRGEFIKLVEKTRALTAAVDTKSE